jgi:microcystin-dependent protein
MAEKISDSKGFDNPVFDTYVPELEEGADIRDALELFFYGNSEDGNATGDVSLYETLIDFDTRIDVNNDLFIGHASAIFNVHGTGVGSRVVGTIDQQTLTNKTLTSPTITSPTVTGTATLPSTTSIGNVSSTEISYVDGVTSPIQTQINTNTPVGMISIHAGATAPTGWLLCQGQAVSRTTYSGLFGVVSTTYGSGDGSTTFNLPNLKGRVVVGIDTAQTQFDVRGETGGSMNHQHAAGNSGNTDIRHNHTIPVINGSAASAGGHGHAVNSNHAHSINHGHSDNFAAGNSGNHGHGDNFATGGSNQNTTRDLGTGGGVATPAHSHTVNGSVSGGGDHKHSINGSVTATSNANSGTYDDPKFNTTSNTAGAHSHSVSTVASETTATRIGSAVDTISGNTAFNHAHTTPVSSELSNLQPYMALNYIIKI